MAADSSSDNSRRVVIFQTTVLVVLIIGLISTLLLVKILPFSCENITVFSSFVGFWNFIRCVLSSPLYICIIINSMVVLIAASSAFHRHDTDNHHHDDNIVIQEPPPLLSPPPPPPPPSPLETLPQSRTSEECSKVIIATSTLYQDSNASDHNYDSISPHIFPYNNSTPQSCIEESHIIEAHKTIKKTEHSQHDKENHEEEEEDTMDATWKAITRDPNRKQLRKSDTFGVVHAPAPPVMRKSETFNETVRRRGGGDEGTIRRDPSVGLDELNHQVEAFIKKFNDDMRLQRQESDQRFLDMIKRGL